MLDLVEQISGCSRCPLRPNTQCPSASQVVCPSGDPHSRVVIVGETPGAEEDLMGRPFEGREGRLLKKLLREAGLADVYLTLAVKCLPIPAKAVYQCNINACKTWLWKELQAVAPRVVVTLGPIPTRLLLKLKSSFRMQDVVGQFHDVPFMSALVAPWYSPRWVLSHGSKADKQAVEFFKQVKEKSDGAGES